MGQMVVPNVQQAQAAFYLYQQQQRFQQRNPNPNDTWKSEYTVYFLKLPGSGPRQGGRPSSTASANGPAYYRRPYEPKFYPQHLAVDTSSSSVDVQKVEKIFV